MKNSIPSPLRKIALMAILAGLAAHAEQAIVGGKSIHIRVAPWQLLLQMHQGGGIQVATCGASWLGGRWALTASHCTEVAKLDSIVAHAGITRREEKLPSNAFKVKRYIRHPDHPFEWKDIAILEFEKDITAADARPIRMATAQDAARGLTDPGVAVMATGWGGLNRGTEPADTLQMVMSKVHPGTNNATPNIIEWAGLGGPEEVGACQGDSGGPLAVKDSSGTGWILAGISSRIFSYCGDANTPSSYTRVSKFESWVQQQIDAAVGIHPLPVARTADLSPFPGGFFLERGQVLDVTLAKLNGARIRTSRSYYPAGAHRLPADAAGSRILRIRASKEEIVLRGF